MAHFHQLRSAYQRGHFVAKGTVVQSLKYTILTTNARRNLILDPSLESTGSQFYSLGSAGTTTGLTAATVHDTTHVLYGSKAALLQILNGTGSGQFYLRNQSAFTPIAGKTYRYSAYIFILPTSTITTVNIAIRDFSTFGNLAITTAAVTAGQWTRISTPTYTATTANPQWLITIADAASTNGVIESYWVDGALMEADTTTVNPYFDGSQTGSVWAGSANVSISQNNFIPQALKYTVKQTPSALTQGLIYRVDKSPGAITKSLKYTIHATPAAKTLSAKYTVHITQTAKTLSAKYEIDTTKTAITKSLRYAIDKSRSVSRAIKYTVKTTPGAKTAALKYTVDHPTGAITKSTKYTVVTTPLHGGGGATGMLFAITKVGSPGMQLTAKYNINPSRAITKSLKYTTKVTPAAKTLALKYEIKKTATAITKSARYTVKGSVAKTLSLKYAVHTTKAAVTRGLIYEIKKAPGAITKSAKYTIHATPAPKTLGLIYRVDRTPGGITKSLEYTVVVHNLAQRSLKYGIVKSHSITKFLQYATANQGTNAILKNLSYTIRKTHAQTLSARYTIDKTRSFTKTAVYAVKAGVKKILTDKYTVKVSKVKTLPNGYAVITSRRSIQFLGYAVTITQPAITLQAKYRIVIPITKQLAYMVRNTVTALTQALRYEVRTSEGAGIPKMLRYAVFIPDQGPQGKNGAILGTVRMETILTSSSQERVVL